MNILKLSLYLITMFGMALHFRKKLNKKNKKAVVTVETKKEMMK